MLVKCTFKVHVRRLFHNFYLGDFADLILINAVLIMDFAQFLGCNFSVITSMSFLIWQAPGDWDSSSGNPSVSEVILVIAATSWGPAL